MRKLPFWKQLSCLWPFLFVWSSLKSLYVCRPQLVLRPSTTLLWPLTLLYASLISWLLLSDLTPRSLRVFISAPTCPHLTTVRREATQLRGSLCQTGFMGAHACISTAPCTLKTPALDLVSSPGKTLSSVTPPLYIVLFYLLVSVLSQNLS